MAHQTKSLTLTIVRHGQTEANVKKIIHGWTDTPLNDAGINQAQAAGKALKDFRFDQAYSSDLQRANQTCQIILKENINSSINAENVIKEKLLKERNFGVLEGESYDIIPSIIEKNGEGFVPENGESGNSVQDRSRQFLKSIMKFDEICETNGKLSILIVSHGGWIRRTLG